MTSRSVSIAAVLLLMALAAVWPVVSWLQSEIGDTRLHGPVALIGVLPLVALVAIGSLALAIAVARKRMGTAVTIVAFLPLGALVLMALGVIVLVV